MSNVLKPFLIYSASTLKSILTKGWNLNIEK